MSRRAIPSFAAAIVGTIAIALTPTCGGSSSPPDPNASSQTVCEPGRQLECTCSNAARGSQMCSGDGAGFLPCVCDSQSVGGRGSGGSGSGNGGTPIAVGGQTMSGGEPGVPTDGGAGGAGGAADGSMDPCPAGNLVRNCSGSCDNPVKCTLTGCKTAQDQILIDRLAEGESVVIRTPDNPGVVDAIQCPPCSNGAQGVVAAFTIVTAGPTKIEVAPPWFFLLPSFEPKIGCDSFFMPPQCHVSGSYVTWLVATTDPNAPSRNVRISYNTDFHACDGQ